MGKMLIFDLEAEPIKSLGAVDLFSFSFSTKNLLRTRKPLPSHSFSKRMKSFGFGKLK